MEILCETGDVRLDEMTKVIVKRAAEEYPLPDEKRLVLSDHAASAGEGDFLILLYRSHAAPSLSVLNCRTTICRALRLPYSIRELEGTVRQLLSAAPAEAAVPEKSHGAASVSPDAVFDGRTVSTGDIAVSLTKREAAVFGVLYENRGKPVSREKLTEAVWGRETETNLCDVYVCHLRGKLEPVFGKGFLTNLRNEGYMMV